MTDLAGFDACFAVGAGGVGQALQSQIQPLARTAVRGVPLPLPNSPSSTLDVNLDVSPSSTIAAGQVTVTATGTGDLRMGVNGQSMVDIPLGGTLPGALANVPISVSAIPFSITLVLTITRPGTATQVTIGRSSVQVTTPNFPPATLETDIASSLTTQLNAILAGTGTVVASQVNNTADALAAAIPAAVAQVVQQRLESLFPLPIPFTLPAVSPDVFCNIGLRNVQIALLPAGTGTAPCLAIVSTLLPDSTGNLQNLRSPLPTNEAAGVFFDNHFLIRSVCCGLRNAPQFRNLRAPTEEPERGETVQCCRWTGIDVESVMDGRSFRVKEASLCLDQTDPNAKKFVMKLTLKTSDIGWTATVNVEADITLAIRNGVVVPQIGEPRIDISVDFEWWVVAIAILLVTVVTLLVAVLVGVIVGAIAVVIGAAASAAAAGLIGASIAGVIVLVLGIFIAVAVNDALRNSVSDSLRAATSTVAGGLDALRIVPPELQEAFGELEAARLVFDDLRVFGRAIVAPPVDERPIIVVEDHVLLPGQGIDLDHAATLPTSDPDCDLVWRAQDRRGAFGLADGLAARGSAALVRITGARYETLGLAALRRLTFPPTGGFIPAAAFEAGALAGRRTGIVFPLRPFQRVVFGVRTGERRFARCSGFVDSSGSLHLRYTVFEVPTPLRLTHTWRTTRRIVGTLPLDEASRIGPGPVPEFDVVRTCRLQATPVALTGPVTYAWTWNGAPLRSGLGPLPGGLETVQVSGATCTVTAMPGQEFKGEICVRATDRFGVPAQVCRDLVGTGRDSVFELVEPTLLAPGRRFGPVPREAADVAAEAEPAELPDLASQLLGQLEGLAAR